jgi:hypothetical protein
MWVSQFRTIYFLGKLVFILASCSRLEQSEKEKLRQRNCKGEFVYRAEADYFYPIGTPEHTPRAPYPWESEANLPRITKEFFRCKGNPSNPPIAGEPTVPPTLDCEGGQRHGLPILCGREGVYPILLDLLNYIQKKTGRRVVITCGHRCPTHNSYADSSKENRLSKHQVGAEVDFYVQGMEDRAQEIVGLLMQYYRETPGYQADKEYDFKRYEKADSGTEILPWMNKEIYIKFSQKTEGRDADNRHPYPYITLQVRYDKSKGERVLYDWNKANKGYLRNY